jgi:beta-lactamase superfamily II metal-dependent hydrolase
MPPTRHLRACCSAALLVLSFAAPAAAVTATGRLQVIHLDVGQGDGALIISPLGATVLIDEGPSGVTPAMGVTVVNQLKALGVTHVDYHFASHYHSDHIGNIAAIVAAGISIGYGWDRAQTYNTVAYTTYVNTLGSTRRTLVKNQVIMLDSLSAHPVRIKCVDLAGAGLTLTPLTDENSACLTLKVSYGEFDEVFGGDLTGGAEGDAHPNVESVVAAAVGPVEVYKVHHHGSRFSSNTTFMNAILPQIAVISCGNGNSFGHPTAGALSRIHAVGTKTYWTETGLGATPIAGLDKVSNGQVIISAGWEGAAVDTIRGNGFADTFTNSGSPSLDVLPPIANLTSPDGGEVWKVGSSHALLWSASDNIGVSSVDLAWSDNAGATWIPIANAIANTGSYAWSVPASATSAGRARVIAHDAAGNLGADSSSAAFAIDSWSITASAATGGTITPSGVVAVAEGANSGFSVVPGNGFQISDLTVDAASVGALSAFQFNAVAAYHTIAASFLDIAAPSVTVTSPAGGEVWAQGSVHNVTWTATDNQAVQSVNVEYSRSGPLGPWLPVANALANTGAYPWTTPSLNSDSAQVRVTAYDPALNAGTASSAGLFQLGSSALGVGGAGAFSLALDSPSPNPSSGLTRMGFSLPQAGSVRIEVYDLSGRRVWLQEGALPAGVHSPVWNGRAIDGSQAGGGLYFVRLVTPWGTRGRRLVRLR